MDILLNEDLLRGAVKGLRWGVGSAGLEPSSPSGYHPSNEQTSAGSHHCSELNRTARAEALSEL